MALATDPRARLCPTSGALGRPRVVLAWMSGARDGRFSECTRRCADRCSTGIQAPVHFTAPSAARIMLRRGQRAATQQPPLDCRRGWCEADSTRFITPRPILLAARSQSAPPTAVHCSQLRFGAALPRHRVAIRSGLLPPVRRIAQHPMTPIESSFCCSPEGAQAGSTLQVCMGELKKRQRSCPGVSKSFSPPPSIPTQPP
jgi:hypothetical protein